MDRKNQPANRTAGAEGEAPDGGASRPAGVPDEALHRLDKRTYLDKEQGKYKASLTDYGGGLCEVGWAFVPNFSPFKAALRGESVNREENKDRAVRRARSTMRKKVLAYGLWNLQIRGHGKRPGYVQASRISVGTI